LKTRWSDLFAPLVVLITAKLSAEAGTSVKSAQLLHILYLLVLLYTHHNDH
jgi:hypothetical protein